jgi:hypothetical protein
MSALLPKRTNSRRFDISALCHKATFALQQIFLFDHFVGGDDQAGRHSQPERIRGFKIEDGFVFGRLHHRQIGDLLALENAPFGLPSDAEIGTMRVSSGSSGESRLSRRAGGVVEEEPS